MSLLPAYMNETWACIEEICLNEISEIDLNLLSIDPLKCHSSALVFLAWEYGIDVSGLTENEQREFIYFAMQSSRYAGSVLALENIVNSIGDALELIEWFSYAGEPYHFKIDISASNMQKVFSEELFLKIGREIQVHKNKRSVLDELTIKLANATGKIETAGAGALSAKLANELNLDYQSFGSFDIEAGGIMDVNLSSGIEVQYPQTDINIQGVGIWTI